METDSGGWTVFQRRLDGSVPFALNWVEYVEGFGDLEREFWLGLDKIHRLTAASVGNMLRIDLKDLEHEERYAEYSTFDVKGPDENYRLSVGGYSGDAGDSLAFHNRRYFSTLDTDNDDNTANCAAAYNGGWWYAPYLCHTSNLNGYYYNGTHSVHLRGVYWQAWHGPYYSLAVSEMKVRNYSTPAPPSTCTIGKYDRVIVC